MKNVFSNSYNWTTSSFVLPLTGVQISVLCLFGRIHLWGMCTNGAEDPRIFLFEPWNHQKTTLSTVHAVAFLKCSYCPTTFTFFVSFERISCRLTNDHLLNFCFCESNLVVCSRAIYLTCYAASQQYKHHLPQITRNGFTAVSCCDGAQTHCRRGESSCEEKYAFIFLLALSSILHRLKVFIWQAVPG